MATKKTTKKAQSEKKYKKWSKLDPSVLGTAAKGRQIREDEAAKKGKNISNDEARAEFGQYKEDTGGGEPMGQGTKYSKGGRGVWKEEYGQEPARAKGQPRTADGKFTYNSVNGKETKYESRGETVNPLLTGGKNGIKIDDVKEQFAGKSGEYWDKYKDIWYEKGSKAVMVSKDKKGYTAPHTAVSLDDIWDIAKHYNPQTGQFSAKFGSDKDERANWENKPGARSKEERAEHQKAAKGKEERFMADKAGGISKEAPTAAPTPKFRKIAPQQPQSQVTPTSPVVNNPAPAPSVSAQPAPTPTPVAPAPTAAPKAAPVQNKPLQDFSGDISLAKSNPGQFANKYRNEISAMLHIIHKQRPNFPARKLISLIGSGKIGNIDAVKKVFNVK